MLNSAYAWIGKYTAYDYETITIDNTAGGIGLTSSKLTTAIKPKRCFISVEGAQLRYRIDGTAPTSTVGHILNPMDVLTIEGVGNMINFRAIRTGATSATIQVTYER